MSENSTTQSSTSNFEIGLHSFVDFAPSTVFGESLTPQQRIKDLLEEIRLADEVGLDVFGIGEHHRDDYLASAPTTILAAAASITKKIRLTSAVTVLGTEDPVRVFQQFATLDLISNGRAEIMAGRGSFSESFPLFLGQTRFDYDDLFAEKLELLLLARAQTSVHWQGNYRANLNGQNIYPRPVQNPLPIWLAVGGTPESAYRAGQLGLPMALAIIGGMPERFAGFAEIYYQAAREHRHAAVMSINSHGFLAESKAAAINNYFPAHADKMNRIGRERGWPPMQAEQFANDVSLRGAVFVGEPEAIIEKILFQHNIFHHNRFLLQTVGVLPHAQIMKSIELLGEKVAPVVRKEIANSKPQHLSGNK